MFISSRLRVRINRFTFRSRGIHVINGEIVHIILIFAGEYGVAFIGGVVYRHLEGTLIVGIRVRVRMSIVGIRIRIRVVDIPVIASIMGCN